jgi:PKD repeat protein
MDRKNYFRKFLSLFIVLLIFDISFAQKPSVISSLQIIPDETEASIIQNNMRINQMTGVPVALYKPNYQVNADTPERMARQYLSANHNLFKFSSDLSELRYYTTRETPGGYHVHFNQFVGEYPVLNSRINVTISKDNRVVFVSNGSKINYNTKVQNNVSEINISSEQALSAAKNYLGIKGNLVFEKCEPGIYYNKGVFRLAQVATIIPAEEIFGEWQILIDARTGEIFRVEDKACYDKPLGDNPQLVDGSGYVFDPDPITHARTTYGTTGFLDNNDADSDSLTFHRELRTLNEISFEGGVYILKGPWAEIRDFESPSTGLHTNSSSDFFFTRLNDSFEAVNVYYHIDNSMRWVNNSLGFTLTPFQYVGGVRFDPHGLSGDDNSHYLPSTGSIAYGDGGVDDAEDLGVVLHELGHGIHDWITNGGLSQVEGLSEGSCDYWCTSYIRSTGYWTTAYPAYNWVFIWDGHNPFWDGRIVNYTAHYPEGLTGTIHTDGQMWASSLMSIYDMIGKVPTDRNFLEALSMTNGSSGQVDAANAFIAADQLLYSGSHLAQIIPVFADRGYIEGPIVADFTADITNGPIPLTVQFTDLSISQPNPITSWQWDFNNDGVVDATTQNPSWTFTNIGYYTVKLTVSDGTNYAAETKTNYIHARDPNALTTTIDIYPQNINYWTGTCNSSAKTQVSLVNAINTDVGWMAFDVSSIVNDPTTVIDEIEFNGYLYANNWPYWSITPMGTVNPITGTASAINNQVSNNYQQGTAYSFNQESGTMTNGWLQRTLEGTAKADLKNALDQGWFAIGVVDWDFSTSYYVEFQGWAEANKPYLTVTYTYSVPVELTSFTALSTKDEVKLNWTTATEINNQGFEVERMNAGGTFEQVGYVAGFGTTTEPKTYSFIDSKLETGNYTYRLKQIDFDGNYEYSDELNVEVELPLEYTLEQNYPNPFNPSTTIKYSIAEDGFVKLAVYNMLGEQLAALVNTTQKAGKYEVSFNASNFSSGVYVYRIETSNFTSSKKLMLMK